MEGEDAMAGVSPPAVPQSPTPAAEETTTQTILAAIEGCKAVLTAKIDHLAVECTLIRHDLDKIRNRLTTAESRVSDVEDTIQGHTSSLTHLERTVRFLSAKVDEQKIV